MKLPSLAYLILMALVFTSSASSSTAIAAGIAEADVSQVETAVLDRIYSGFESMHYSVSWSGGVKIGDLYLNIVREPSRKDAYRINARVKDYGPLQLVYPIDDTFDCYVRGPLKLPYQYEVLQKEGFGKETKRLTRYDQRLRYVLYQKNKEPEERFDLEGIVYNEFAAFFISRALKFSAAEEFIVPAFVDKKRHEVKVVLLGREKRATLFGEKETLKVMPKMQFKGLYDKKGDTVFWMTDDPCRVPVEIHSKIIIGSLVAELVEYTNPSCGHLKPMTAGKDK